MPDAILQANYHQTPIDIQGRLFPRDELQYITRAEFDALAQAEAVEGTIGYNDVADDGDDFLSAPFGQIIGQKCYVMDVVFSQEGVEKTSLRVAQKVQTTGCQLCYFESNNGGKTFALLTLEKLRQLADEVQEAITCKFKWKAAYQNKETRIFMQSEYIKKHIVFLDPSEYTKSSEYGIFMQQIWDYNAQGDNLHDDAPDSIHGLSKLLEMLLKRRKKGNQAVEANAKDEEDLNAIDKNVFHLGGKKGSVVRTQTHRRQTKRR